MLQARIIETLKEIRITLLAQQTKVYTDHKNLTTKFSIQNKLCNGDSSLKKNSSELIYIQGSKNIAADALNRLDKVDTSNNAKNNIKFINEL